MICHGCGIRPVVAYSGLLPKPTSHIYHPECWRSGPLIGPGDRVRIRQGFCGAGYSFVVESLYDNTAAPVDPCIQVYGTNHYGPVRLNEVEKITTARLPTDSTAR